ncbi:hypothetical protein [Agilicoccus flavus]|uniref:hypothetical protein n=1 Tax=Agilicoccus flavus TaxID=2775968 RepID=UPI001CF66AF1|nr:hypothetical protein [Agilicoccus flavus]
MSTDDQTPEVDPRDNPESQTAEDTASQTGTRSAEGGAVMSDAPTAGEGADGVIGGRVTGTDSGDLLSGVTISEDDAQDAVPGDTGPEHHGERR